VRQATCGRGVDHVVESGALDSLPRSIASCAAEAEVALVAALGQGQLDAAALSAPVSIRRLYVGSAASFDSMCRAIEAHRLRPLIGKTFGFDEAARAYAEFASKRHVGKVVIAG
jgi:NADPH:quinone reductase-like Zn-dependent oxidoreductase